MFDLTMVVFYTLLRPEEYTSLRWSWYDEEAGLLTIPAEVMKMKKPHTVPVSTQLAVLFKALKFTKVNDFVFLTQAILTVRLYRRVWRSSSVHTALMEYWFLTESDQLVVHGWLRTV